MCAFACPNTHEFAVGSLNYLSIPAAFSKKGKQNYSVIHTYKLRDIARACQGLTHTVKRCRI